ncbi:MAG TPA: M48 family metallopeptidase [Gammaproteobacteria bacterium]|nr:M48 family metallopeptidase [Gammaproteobacteria bacterium]
MDFFARQEATRRTSRLLVGLFLLSFAIVAAATTAVVTVALRFYTENNALFLGTATWSDWVAGHFGLTAVVALGTFALMGFASLGRAASLAGGGSHVARMLGATQITGDGSDPLQRRLLNVVEEMALASGVPVPEVYVLEQEAGINAFAAGTTPANAAIAVTRGALERLERAELQGVIGHEFSHILNGDMRLNQQLIGLSFGILVLSLAGRWMLRSARFGVGGRDRNNGVAAIAAIGLALTIIGAIGLLLSRLIKAGVSRQREALADASAVQFTREPQGLAGALKKIAGYTGRLTSVETEEVAHMMFERASRSFTGLFATHPPLLARIRALDPAFDPRDLEAAAAPLPEPIAHSALADQPGIAALAPRAAAAPLERAGEIETPEVGGALRAALPAEILSAARSRDSSLLLVVALALASGDETRSRQLGLVESQLGKTRAVQCASLFAALSAVPRQLRLPLLELALPALKQRPREQVAYLFELLGRLRELDGEERLFDYVLLRVLEAYFRGVAGAPLAAHTAAQPKLAPREAARALLASVAAHGAGDAAAARAAYAVGITALGWRDPAPAPAFEPLAAARNLRSLDAALLALGAVKPRDKLRMLEAVLATIRADRRIEIDEHELFRAIAAALDCPLPPGFTA